MAFSGADVEQLRRLAHEFSDASERLQSTASRLGGLIHQAAWRGPDASRFVADWDSVLAPTLRRAAWTLQDASEQTRRNAQEQEQVSS